MQGWVLRAGGPPPALSGVFLPRFFLRYRRKNRAPGGRWQACLADIKKETFSNLQLKAQCAQNKKQLTIPLPIGYNKQNRQTLRWGAVPGNRAAESRRLVQACAWDHGNVAPERTAEHAGPAPRSKRPRPLAVTERECPRQNAAGIQVVPRKSFRPEQRNLPRVFFAPPPINPNKILIQEQTP